VDKKKSPLRRLFKKQNLNLLYRGMPGILLVTDAGNDPGFLIAGMCGIPAIPPDVPQADYAEGVLFRLRKCNIRRHRFVYFRY
jgi:hypothetical protein